MHKVLKYKLIFDATYCVRDHEDLYETLASKCANSSIDCTVGFLNCPFSKDCSRITKEDWAKILTPSTETNDE